MRTDWIETTLGEISRINPESTRGLDPETEVSYIDLSSVAADTGIDSDLFRGPYREAPGRARRIVRTGDVLVATVRPYLRGFAVVPESLDGELASTGFCVIRSVPGTSLSGFIWSLVRTDEFVNYLMSRATGSSYPAVRPEDVASFQLLLPPMSAQRRIVDLLSAIDNYVDSLTDELKMAKIARLSLIHDVLFGNGEIPESYDRQFGLK